MPRVLNGFRPNAFPEEATPQPLSIDAIVRARLTAGDTPDVSDFVEHLTALPGGDSIAAIVFYGSMLSATTAGATSVFDFYVIVDGYRPFIRKRFHRLLARVLPPTTYRLKLGAGDAVRECKYCVISKAHLKRETGEKARDYYHLGRFSKRIAIAYARDDDAVDTVVDAVAAALETLAPQALAGVPTHFSVEQFSRAMLAISYRGEVRPEGDEKVEKLYTAERDYYERLHAALLEAYREACPGDFKAVTEPGAWALRRTVSDRAAEIAAVKKKIRRSRRRSVIRWPKQIFLFDDWLDFLIAKVERSWGVDIRGQMTEKELRHPLIYGWKRFFQLRRQGKIR